jgi:hypothetical protein
VVVSWAFLSSLIPNRGSIILSAARHRLPAVYPFRYFAAEGGLMAYGPDQIDQWRGAATYADRILRGEKPGELPVQTPAKYELVINQGRQRDRIEHRARIAAPRQRGDRIKCWFVAVHESAIGPKRTLRPHLRMSAIGGEADIAVRRPQTEIRENASA